MKGYEGLAIDKKSLRKVTGKSAVRVVLDHSGGYWAKLSQMGRQRFSENQANCPIYWAPGRGLDWRAKAVASVGVVPRMDM